MKNILICTIVAFLATSVGLYAQEKENAQEEPVQAEEINPIRDFILKDEALSNGVKLELVWEKEIPEGVSNFVFLDEDGYNVFSVQCKDPVTALKEKRVLMVQDGELKLFEGDEMRLAKEIALRGGNITISKNGRNIATIEGLEPHPSGKGGFADKPATLRLCNWKGEELASTQISPAGWEYINLYPLGNDKTIAMSRIGGEGTSYRISVFVREGLNLVEKFNADGQYPTGTLDYAEDGSVVFFLQTKWDAPIDYEERIKFVERIVIDGAGKEIARYTYQHPGWAGWVSPRGNYLVEVTRGKYVVIRDRKGQLIAEHHVQGQGNYYAAFSPDEKYLCVTPGSWRVYFFETKTGRMLWEYVEMESDSFSFFFSLATSDAGISFVGSSRWQPLSVLGSAKKDKIVLSFDESGNIVGTSEVFVVRTEEEQEFYTWHPTPPVRITPDGRYLIVRLSSQLLLYRIIQTGGGR